MYEKTAVGWTPNFQMTDIDEAISEINQGDKNVVPLLAAPGK